MSDTIMAEEMQPQKKAAFANRKYTNEERIQKEEKEPFSLGYQRFHSTIRRAINNLCKGHFTNVRSGLKPEF